MNKQLIPAALALGVLAFSAGGTSTSTIYAAASEPANTNTIAAYGSDSLIESDGTYWVWGQNHSVPTQIHELSDVAASFSDRIIMKNDLSVWHWEPTASATEYKVEPIPALKDIAAVTDTWLHTFVIEKDGDVFTIPREGIKIDWDGIKPLSEIDHVKQISIHAEYPSYDQQELFLKTDGTVWKSNEKLEKLEQVKGLDHIVEVSGRFALKQDGTVWKLPFAVDSTVDPNAATQLTEVSGILMLKSIGVGDASTVAIDKQSHLWFWGTTRTGWSDGTVLHEQEPKQLTSLNGVVDAFVVERSLLALTRNGKLYSTSTDLETLPKDPPFELLTSDISSVKAGARHLIMQKKDGSLWGWGVNKEAMLGNGDYEFEHLTPVPVQKPIAVELNGEHIALSNGVVTLNGQAFIPIRSIFERMGATVGWDANNKIATVRSADNATQIAVDFKLGTTKLNGKQVELSNDPFSTGGTSYLPLRFISESLGAKVDWVQQTNRITITMK
ncbi:copper amine oxidase-like protein [Paenibacillus taihuensis]|uniref:Copper amine oxidase-like protein n=1 Tax=Paenibacillus taihuensis TaxID=1156355 RepID=A0A3D9RNN8_9BACL|nr:stalk domain-containing protein [Paenibacillus taihuensis]REE81519.1 copper amine oxidase-like protein [Paenibacillus taihuensis]